jgi:hypothetical protein
MEEWKLRSFRYDLNKKDIKLFDQMLTISASNCVKLIEISCIIMSIRSYYKNNSTNKTCWNKSWQTIQYHTLGRTCQLISLLVRGII